MSKWVINVARHSSSHLLRPTRCLSALRLFNSVYNSALPLFSPPPSHTITPFSSPSANHLLLPIRSNVPSLLLPIFYIPSFLLDKPFHLQTHAIIGRAYGLVVNSCT